MDRGERIRRGAPLTLWMGEYAIRPTTGGPRHEVMKKSEAKKLIELQACITYLLDEFLLELEQLPESEEKASLKRSATQAIGTCVADILIPIFTQYPSLDYIGCKENTLIASWIRLARKRRFEEAAAGK